MSKAPASAVGVCEGPREQCGGWDEQDAAEGRGRVGAPGSSYRLKLGGLSLGPI